MRVMKAKGMAGLIVAAGVAVASQAWAGQPVTIMLKDHHFAPDRITVPAGERFRIELTNMDPTVGEFESYDMHFEKIVVGNGGKIHVLAGPLHAGETYKFFDDYDPDGAQGVITAVDRQKK